MMRALAVLLALPGAALAADKIPVAVLWVGEAGSPNESPEQIVEQVNAALARSAAARPIDSVENRRLLAVGGTASQVAAVVRDGDALFVKLKFADAAQKYEKAEQMLFEDVPFAVLREQLGAIERNLLVCYDQLHRPADATRAALRLSWTAGSNEDLQQLIDRYFPDRRYEPQHPPVPVRSLPEGAVIFRDLQPAGVTPGQVPGGDPVFDMIDIEAPGYRRAHVTLPSGFDPAVIDVTLQKEDRLGALVDQIRAMAPEAPESDVARLGARLGAERVLVIGSDGPGRLAARWLDVKKSKWSTDTMRADAHGQPAMDKLAAFVAPAGPTVTAQAAVAKAPPPAKKKGAWGKWYTWVAAAGVVALVGGLLIAEHVGDDKVTITSSH